MRHGLEAKGDDHAVFIQQWHDVSDRRQRGQLPQGLNRLHAAQRLHQLEGHARAAQAAERIIAQQRIEHSGTVGQLRPELVVIGDDHAHAQLLRAGDLVRARDAAVHRDEQPGMRGDLLHRRHVEAVALAVPVRNVIAGLRALLAQVGQQNGRRRHAVHVVIAEDDDLLVLRKRVPDDRNRLVHVLHAHWIVQVFHPRMQIPVDLLRRIDSAVQQQAKQLVRHAERPERFGNLPLLVLLGHESEHMRPPFCRIPRLGRRHAVMPTAKQGSKSKTVRAGESARPYDQSVSYAFAFLLRLSISSAQT